jgi:hypothetical protein
MNLKLAAASCKRTSLEINEREESCLTIVLCWRRIGTEFNRINNFNIYREKETINYLDMVHCPSSTTIFAGTISATAILSSF